jgi:uncharacterized protein YbaP (TraB family)
MVETLFLFAQGCPGGFVALPWWVIGAHRPGMSHLFRGLMAVALVLLSGCSTHRMAEKTRLPWHPIHETRMTNQPAPGYVATGVWRVRGASNVVYLAGTSHIVADEEIPFPTSYYAAYRDAREIYVEVDSLSFSGTWMMVKMLPGAVKFMTRNMKDFVAGPQETLEDYVTADTAQKLREHFGADYETKWIHLTPLGLVFFAEFASTQGGEGGVDDLFTLLAHRDEKRIRSLDDSSTTKLVAPLLEALLEYARKDLAQRGADAVLQEMLRSETDDRDDWRYGEMKAAIKELEKFRKDAPIVYEQLLPERNRRWYPTIRAALAGQRNAMVLVGALHLPGEDGLIEMLRRDGFQPEQMYGIDRPER